MGALVGAGVGSFFYGSASLDQLFNPQIIDVIRHYEHWYQYLTTQHALTPLFVDHPREVIGIPAAIGGALGSLARRNY